MYSRFRCVKASYPPQLYERDLIPSAPPHGYYGTPTTAGYRNTLQQQRFVYNATEWLPTAVYDASNMESTSLHSPASSDLQSNTMSEASFADECSGQRCNVGESLHFPGSNEFISPPHMLASKSKDFSFDKSALFNPIASPKASENSFGMYGLLEPTNWCQKMPFGPTCFDSVNDVATSSQSLLSSINDSIAIDDAGRY
jgi:hypothetical protein